MDISKPPVTGSLNKDNLSHQNRGTDQSNSLGSSVKVGLKVGEVLSAQVSKLSPLTNAERSSLLAQKSLAPSLVLLLQSAKTQLAEIKINQTHTLHALTDKPLNAKQTIAIEVMPGGKIKLLLSTLSENQRLLLQQNQSKEFHLNTSSSLNKPVGQNSSQHLNLLAKSSHVPNLNDTSNSASPENRNTTLDTKNPYNSRALPALQHDISANLFAKQSAPEQNRLSKYVDASISTKLVQQANLASEKLNSSLSNDPRFNTLAQNELISAIKQSLPYQKPMSQSFKGFSEIFLAVEQLPTHVRQKIMPDALYSQIKSLNSWLNTTQTNISSTSNSLVFTPTTIKNLLLNSGIALEQKLLTSNMEKNNTTGQARPSQNPKIEQDLKTLLLLLEKTLSQESANVSDRNPNTSSKNTSLSDLLALLMRLGNKTTNGDHSTHKGSREQLLQQLTHLNKSALTRIQLLQQQALTERLTDTEGRTSHLQLEIPLKFSDSVGNLFVSIHQHPHVEEKQEEDNASANQSEREGLWKVFMEFDLDELGTLATEVALQDKQLKVLFWASETSIREKAREQLNSLRTQLESKGMDIQQLECSLDMPPIKPIKMNYSLVDIST